jgi:hypothetical protein
MKHNMKKNISAAGNTQNRYGMDAHALEGEVLALRHPHGIIHMVHGDAALNGP